MQFFRIFANCHKDNAMLKKLTFSCLALCLSCLCGAQTQAYGDLYDSETVSDLKDKIEYLSSPVLKGRKAGSAGELDAAEYFAARLRDAGVELLTPESGEIFGIKTETDTIVSRNVYGVIQGYDKTLKNSYIVIGARLDNLGVNVQTVDGQKREQIFCGANGNASGLAMLLELAKLLQKNSVLLRRSVVIAAFGASLPLQAGSWYFLNDSFKGAGSVDAMINLDMVGTGGRGFYVYTASNPDLNSVVSRLAGTLQPVQPQLVGMEPVPSDHRSFYNKEIPAVFFTTGMYPEYNSAKDLPEIIEYDAMEREMEYIYNFTLALANGPKPSFNKNEDLKKTRIHVAPDAVPYSECDIPPSFLGSLDPTSFLTKWVYTYLKYPQDCIDQGIQGRVLIDFTVDEKGRVGDVKVLRGIDPRLDDEAVRVVSASPNWKPGRVRGRKVKSEVSMYVEFRLTNKKKNGIRLKMY